MTTFARIVGWYERACFRRGVNALRRFLADPDDQDEADQHDELDRLAAQHRTKE